MVSVVVVFFISKIQSKKSVWFGLLTYLCLISFGIAIHHFHQHKNLRKHYSKYLSTDKEYKITLKIRERLKPNLYNQKYVAHLIKVNGSRVKGKILVNLQRDSLKQYLKIDDIFVCSAQFHSINPSLNPNQFNYNTYLKRQNIYHQISVETNFILKAPAARRTIYGYAADFRNAINSKLKAYNFKEDELAIINALLLGQRQDLSKSVYQDYVNAGAIHILAVSGLHIGIILIILNFILKPIQWLKNGFIVKTMVILVLLWSYAVVAGLSASIIRAVTMFSVLAIAMNLKRPTNIYNTIAISLFILLLFKPTFLFEVGFQLSYMAVFAIVSIQPLLYNLWQSEYKLVDYFWQIFTVSMAAQIGVAPISIFYFHQFPGLFFIANLVIIPFLGLILGMGILCFSLALTGLLPKLLAEFFGDIISLMNQIVGWVSKQEDFLFKDLSISFMQMLSFYFLIVSLIVCIKRPQYKNYIAVLVCILIAQGVFINQKFENLKDEFIIFHKNRYSLIGQKNGKNLTVHHNLDSERFQNNRTIKDYEIGNFIESIQADSLNSVYEFNDIHFLVVDSFGIYALKSFKPEYILLRNSPKVNLNRIIDSLKPKYIIADGSNYKSYVKRWEMTCLIRTTKFHDTKADGAFILEKQ